MQSSLVRNLVHAVLAAQEQWLEVKCLPRQLLDEAGGFQGSDLARHLLFDKAKGSGASRDLGRRFALELAALALVSSRRFSRVAVLQEVQGRRTENVGPAFQGVRSLVLEAFIEVCQQRIRALQYSFLLDLARLNDCLLRIKEYWQLIALRVVGL